VGANLTDAELRELGLDRLRHRKDFQKQVAAALPMPHPVPSDSDVVRAQLKGDDSALLMNRACTAIHTIQAAWRGRIVRLAQRRRSRSARRIQREVRAFLARLRSNDGQPQSSSSTTLPEDASRSAEVDAGSHATEKVQADSTEKVQADSRLTDDDSTSALHTLVPAPKKVSVPISLRSTPAQNSLLPALSVADQSKLTLVLDLDETLVHTELSDGSLPPDAEVSAPFPCVFMRCFG
jgi:hypothetical protein